jgi:protein O-mannosyl-transferase
MLVVLLACTLAYSLALDGPLFFDDEPNLLGNERVQIDGTVFDDWRTAALSAESGVLYRPLAMLTFALNHVVAGDFTAFSLKATNLAIHLLVGVLLYGFVRALLQAPSLRGHHLDDYQCRVVALLAAALWLLHPIQVSTVLYAVQRMAQLSALFTLAGLWLFTHYRLRWAERGASLGEVIAASLWIALLGLAAVLSKENGALLPWLIAVVEVTLFRGIWCGRAQRWLVALAWLALAVPVLLLCAIYLVAPEVLMGRYGGREFTLLERLFTQGRALWQYISWMVVPNITSMGFFHDDFALSRGWLSPLSTAVSLVGWAVVLGACLLWYRRYPMIAFAFLFYLVAHSMESTVLPLEIVFEHRNYLPSVGLAALAALGVVKGVAHLRQLRLRMAVASVLAVLTALLLVRTHAWSDEMQLARFNVINHPQSPRANFFYGNALFKRFQQSQALGLGEEEQRALAVAARGYFEKMRQLDPRNFSALVMLYQLDTLYFPGLAEENNWLDTMMELAQTRRLQSSDRTALAALVDFSLSTSVATDRHRVDALLARLVEHYPYRTDIAALQYRFVMATAPTRKAALLPLLEQAARRNVDSTAAAVNLAHYYGNDRLDQTYESIRKWLRRDPLRRELPVVKTLFEQ